MLRSEVGCANTERSERARCALRSPSHWSSQNCGAPGCGASWELGRSLSMKDPVQNAEEF